MAFRLEFSEGVVDDLARLRAFDRQAILAAIQDQLVSEPSQMTRHRKTLEGLSPPFEHVAPVWQLSVGEFRVFYDVNEEIEVVYVRAVRRKAPHKTTKDIP